MTSLNDLIRQAKYFSLAADCSEKEELNPNSRSGHLYKKSSEIYEEIARCIGKEHPKPLYSQTYKRFSERLNQPEVLTNPEKYLGPNWKDVLNLWIYVDTLSYEEKKKMEDRYWTLDYTVRESAWIASWDAATEVVGEKFKCEAWCAADVVTGKRAVFGYATYELIGNVDNKVAYNLIVSYKNSQSKNLL
jgi:hypothetical protein